MFNRSGKIKVKKSPTDGLHSADNQPDKSCPKGIPDVNDRRGVHVDAMQSSWIVFPRDIYTKAHPEYRWHGLSSAQLSSTRLQSKIS